MAEPFDDGCRCWNEGEWGRVHREDCPIHRDPPEHPLDALGKLLLELEEEFGPVPEWLINRVENLWPKDTREAPKLIKHDCCTCELNADGSELIDDPDCPVHHARTREQAQRNFDHLRDWMYGETPEAGVWSGLSITDEGVKGEPEFTPRDPETGSFCDGCLEDITETNGHHPGCPKAKETSRDPQRGRGSMTTGGSQKVETREEEGIAGAARRRIDELVRWSRWDEETIEHAKEYVRGSGHTGTTDGHWTGVNELAARILELEAMIAQTKREKKPVLVRDADLESARQFVLKTDVAVAKSREHAQTSFGTTNEERLRNEVKELRMGLDYLTYAIGLVIGNIDWHRKEETHGA